MNYIFLSEKRNLSDENKLIIKKLLVQCLVEYKFLLTLDNILTKNKQYVIKLLNDNNISIDQPINFYVLFDIIKYDDSGSIEKSLNSHFSEYNGIYKQKFTYNEIDNLIRSIDSNLITFSNQYWNLLNNLECTIDNIYTNLNNLDSQFDAKNYSIYCLNMSLEKKLPVGDFYLIYQMIDDIFSGHIFLIVTNTELSINYIELISIQTSTKFVINYSCKNLKSGIASQIFHYIIDDFYSNVIKKKYYFSYAFIHAYAWKVISELLFNKFDFNNIEYDFQYPDRVDSPYKVIIYNKNDGDYTIDNFLHSTKYLRYKNIEFVKKFIPSLKMSDEDKAINQKRIDTIFILNNALHYKNIGFDYDNSLYILTFKILYY